jgi:hypothetical protein
MVLETLRRHKLYAKASKCQFGRSSVGFLGHVISELGVAVDPRKVAAVAEWAQPTSCTEVRRFVGFANYYRKFGLRFSALAAPLTALCSPRATFRWGAAEQQSFAALKAALTTAPVLRVWDPARPTRLLTDASELAVSAILEQPDDAGAFYPIAFESRKLTQPERLYPPHLLELLAVVHALKTLRPYLLDSPSSCTLIMPACSGSRSSGTSATIRLGGSICLQSTSTRWCIFLAGPTQRTSSRASASATVRAQRSGLAMTTLALPENSTPLHLGPCCRLRALRQWPRRPALLAQRVRVSPSRGPACRPCLRPARRSGTGTRPLPSRRHRRSVLSNGP